MTGDPQLTRKVDALARREVATSRRLVRFAGATRGMINALDADQKASAEAAKARLDMLESENAALKGQLQAAEARLAALERPTPPTPPSPQ